LETKLSASTSTASPWASSWTHSFPNTSMGYFKFGRLKKFKPNKMKVNQRVVAQYVTLGANIAEPFQPRWESST
jgi:hypothetical protein